VLGKAYDQAIAKVIELGASIYAGHGLGLEARARFMYIPSSNKRGFRHPDVLSGRSAPPTGGCRMKPPPPAAYGADGCVQGAPN
jgi:hypothetical protein